MTAALSIHDLVVAETKPLRFALEVIDKNAQGIAFAVDADGRLSGVLTDGDIRRALLKQISLDVPISTVIRRDCVSFPVETPSEKIAMTLSDRIQCIPLLDEQRRPVDFASRHRHHRIPVMEPSLQGNELSYVAECLRTNWISSQGKYVTMFEKAFEDFHGGGHAVAVSNGTVALHLALEAIGLKEGDEVIVPDLTFAASANAVLHAGATPVLVDIEEQTWTLDPERVKAAITPRTKAIMPVHLYGHPCDMDALRAIAAQHKLAIVEDCAESLGASYKGQRVGLLGDAGCFSFFGNKLITTGEGGMILFRDAALAARARMLRDHGMDPARRYWHLDVGYNYRLTNLQAAIGVAQMEQIDQFLAKKKRLAERYDDIFRGHPEILLPPRAPWAENVTWLYTIALSRDSALGRDELMSKLLRNGVDTRPVFFPLHIMPPYLSFVGNNEFPVATSVSQRGMSFPSAVTLTEDELVRIRAAIQTIVGVKSLYNTAHA